MGISNWGLSKRTRQGELLQKELAPTPIRRSREATFAFPGIFAKGEFANSALPSYEPLKTFGKSFEFAKKQCSPTEVK
jgi:hypothetical protein